MKKRVCCLLIGIYILCLPIQQVYAAPVGPVAQEHEKPVPPHEKKHEKPVPPHEKEHKKPVPPHEKEHEKPVSPHEHEHPKPQEEKPEAADKQTESTPVTPPAATPDIVIPEVIPTDTEEVITDNSESAETGMNLVKYALQFVGNPYRYGGTSLTNGADCSGFVQSVYAHFGYFISRTSGEQARNAGYMDVSLKESELQQGDLIFYAKSNGVVFHVALYIGDGKVVHAANSKAGIIVSEYTYMKPYKARRVIE